MNSGQLQDFNKGYISINKNLGKKFLQDYDKYPIILEYKILNSRDPKYILDKIKEEKPLFILSDERLFNFISRSEDIKISSIEIASSKGYWCSMGGIKFYFCNKYFQNDRTKIILYKRSARNSCSIQIHLT